MNQNSDKPRSPGGDWLGSEYLRFERHGRMARVVVDRPHSRNAMTPAMYFGVRYAVDRVNDDPELDGLLITGTGDVFIPGGDLGAVPAASPTGTAGAGARDGDPGKNSGNDDWMDFDLLGMEVTPFDALMNSPKPVVSAINGICQGGGLMIAMLSDVSVASDQATFRAPELLRGIADMYYANVLPQQVGPARARDLLLTGRKLTAHEAEAWGIVSRVVPHDRLLEEAASALESCRAAAPHGRAAVKRGINSVYGRYDRMTMDQSLAGDESREGFVSFKERRPPTWVRD